MSKKKKKSARMIDMSARLNIEIIPSSAEEMIQLEKELDELTFNIQNKVNKYENSLYGSIEKILADKCYINIDEKKTSSYFIEKYEDMLEQRNIEHVKNKIRSIRTLFKKV